MATATASSDEESFSHSSSSSNINAENYNGTSFGGFKFFGDSSSSEEQKPVVKNIALSDHKNIFDVKNVLGAYVAAGESKKYAGIEYKLEGEDSGETITWQNRLTHTTGAFYLTGHLFGGTWGLIEGIRAPLLVNEAKFRWNAILNGVTRRGPLFANRLAGLSVMFTFAELFSTSYAPENLNNGYAPQAFAGFLTGSIAKYGSVMLSAGKEQIAAPNFYRQLAMSSMRTGLFFGAFMGALNYIRTKNMKEHAEKYGYLAS